MYQTSINELAETGPRYVDEINVDGELAAQWIDAELETTSPSQLLGDILDYGDNKAEQVIIAKLRDIAALPVGDTEKLIKLSLQLTNALMGALMEATAVNVRRDVDCARDTVSV